MYFCIIEIIIERTKVVYHGG